MFHRAGHVYKSFLFMKRSHICSVLKGAKFPKREPFFLGNLVRGVGQNDRGGGGLNFVGQRLNSLHFPSRNVCATANWQ